MFIRVLIIVFIISYIVWFVNNRILGKNLAMTRIIAATLVITSLVYLVLGSLSYLVEGF